MALVSVAVPTSCELIPHGEVLARDGRYVLVAPGERSEAGVGFGGTVRLVGDCVGLERERSEIVVVIWPQGTTFISADPVVLDVPGVGHVGIGDQLTGGGDEYDPDDPMPGIEVPDGCGGRSVWSFTPGP